MLFNASGGESSKLSPMHTSPWKSTDRVWRSYVPRPVRPIGESPALNYTRKPLSLALTLRVNTDEHRTTQGEYRGVSIVATACSTGVWDHSLRRLTISTQVLVESMECHKRKDYVPRYSCSILRLESWVEKPDRPTVTVSLLIIRHFCILVQILRYYFWLFRQALWIINKNLLNF